MSSADADLLVMIGQVAMLVFIPFAGALVRSDRSQAAVVVLA